MRGGRIEMSRLLERLALLIRRERKSGCLMIGEWSPLLIDWHPEGTRFYRPHLRGCFSRHFASAAGKALPAIELGMMARCLVVGSRRIPVLCGLIREGATRPLLSRVRGSMRERDVLVADRQVKISHIEQENITHFVIRGAVDFTARGKDIPETTGRGRKPAQGRIVRPLARTYRDKVIAATDANREKSFVYQGRTLTALWFDDLVIPGGTSCSRKWLRHFVIPLCRHS